MDRQIVYPGQILPETSLLQMAKDSMIGVAKLASALLGTSTYATGFAVTPTGPASLQVIYAPGEIYSLSSIDALAFSTLPADTTHSILKQGILLDGGTLSCPAPGTTGQSINYLLQVTYQDVDSTPVLLPYYNSANPAMPYSGAGNNGLTQNTVRKGAAVVSVKAGASAVSGSQVTPSPDVGYIGLYVITVAFGQTTITSGNITLAANAPLINSTLHGLSPVFSSPLAVAPATSSQHAINAGQTQTQAVTAFTTSGSAGTLTLSPVPAIQAYTTPLRFRVKFSQNSTGTDTINISGRGAISLKQYDTTGAKVAAVFALGQLADVEYDGTDAVLLDQLPSALPAATTTASGVARFATTAEQLAGVLATVMSNPIGVLSLLTTWFPKRSFSASDYIRIPDVSGGLIIQWSSVSGASGALVSATFPTAFNTALHVIPFYQFGSDPGSLTNAGGGGTVSVTATGATFRLFTGFTGTRYLAIGF